MKSSLRSCSVPSLYYINWYFFVWLAQCNVCFLLPLISNRVLKIEYNNLYKNLNSFMKIYFLQKKILTGQIHIMLSNSHLKQKKKQHQQVKLFWRVHLHCCSYIQVCIEYLNQNQLKKPTHEHLQSLTWLRSRRKLVGCYPSRLKSYSLVNNPQIFSILPISVQRIQVCGQYSFVLLQ